MGNLKQLVKRLVLPQGHRPYQIRGGALKGLRFIVDLQRDTQVWRGIYEQALQRWLLKHVQCNSICFDVGAAEGWATLLMAKLATRGTVFAFEPSARGDWIDKNLCFNSELALGEVSVVRAYVGRCADEQTGDGQCISLDGFVADGKLSSVDVIKIDVDGPENDVLDGACSVMSIFRPAVCVEAHSRELLDGVLNRLHLAGYRTQVVDPPRHEHRPLEYNPMVFAEYLTPHSRRPCR